MNLTNHIGKENNMKKISEKTRDFNNFRFENLNWHQVSNNYYSMDRVSEDEKKIVVKVADEHILSTKFGYALILDASHVVFLKEWQVSKNYYGNEVLLQKDFFNVKEWGDFSNEFENDPEECTFEHFLSIAKEQRDYKDENGDSVNVVRWEI